MSYKFKNPIRLIELFAGYGSQALALRYLGIPFEHYFVCEFDKYAIQSYNDIHETNFEASDIRDITANDMNIVDTDKYKYLLTYSFPCTDLSLAGKRKGMQRECGTSSSLLWEVERLLKECKELPQYLLMENVPQVISKDNIKLFEEWTGFLIKLGYDNYYQILNAKDYGVPQNRERCFMVSMIKSEHKSFVFPKPKPLEIRLKDVLEDDVDEKYYIKSEKALKFIYKLNENGILSDGCFDGSIKNTKKIDIANCIMSRYDCGISNRERVGVIVIGKLDGSYDLSNRVYCVDGISPTLNCFAGGNTESKILINLGQKYSVRKLTSKECFRLMGVKDEAYNKLTVSNSQKYKQAGNSIVVDVLMAIFENLFLKECKENKLF